MFIVIFCAECSSLKGYFIMLLFSDINIIGHILTVVGMMI